MALIPKVERKPDKKPVSARLDEETRALLDRYAQFLGDASHEYVIGESLRLLFRRDKEFIAWLAKNEPPVQPMTEPNSVTKVSPRPTPSAA
jgi:hypothetical protein